MGDTVRLELDDMTLPNLPSSLCAFKAAGGRRDLGPVVGCPSLHATHSLAHPSVGAAAGGLWTGPDAPSPFQLSDWSTEKLVYF
ncbi:UNVERIFIED_CONTAM: hypothetical protein K2H54_057765 [Gekko kuhli]